jgi:Transposase
VANRPRPSQRRSRPLIEIREASSPHREPSAGTPGAEQEANDGGGDRGGEGLGGRGRRQGVPLGARGGRIGHRAALPQGEQREEADLSALIDEALSLAEDVAWAVDQPGGGAALLLALLWERGQEVAYVPGLSVDRARDGYRGESKTDRKDARVIADQARMRADLGRLEPGDDALAGLQLLLARRRDLLVADRTRAVTRLRETLVALFPALERALNLTTRGPLENWSPVTTAPARSAGRGAGGSPPTSRSAA